VHFIGDNAKERVKEITQRSKDKEPNLWQIQTARITEYILHVKDI